MDCARIGIVATATASATAVTIIVTVVFIGMLLVSSKALALGQVVLPFEGPSLPGSGCS
jgi:hypothetical protein